MNSLIINNKNILNNDGYITDYNDWSEEIAKKLACNAGLNLNKDSLEIIHLVRSCYIEFKLSLNNRMLIKYIYLKLGKHKGNSLYLNKMFNGTPATLIAKLAGIPKPINCL